MHACMDGLDADKNKQQNKQNRRQHRPLAKAFNVLTDWRAWMMPLGSATDGPIVPTSPTSWIALNHQVRYLLFEHFRGYIQQQQQQNSRISVLHWRVFVWYGWAWLIAGLSLSSWLICMFIHRHIINFAAAAAGGAFLSWKRMRSKGLAELVFWHVVSLLCVLCVWVHGIGAKIEMASQCDDDD